MVTRRDLELRESHDTRVATSRPGFLIRVAVLIVIGMDLTPISAWMQGKFCYSSRRLPRYLRVAWPRRPTGDMCCSIANLKTIDRPFTIDWDDIKAVRNRAFILWKVSVIQ